MSACEKCWRDAGSREFSDPRKSRYEHYTDLLKEREKNPCTLEEQKGDIVEGKEKVLSHEVFNDTNSCMEVFDSFIKKIAG